MSLWVLNLRKLEYRNAKREIPQLHEVVSGVFKIYKGMGFTF